MARRAARFVAESRGVAAIEFGLIAAPFLALVTAILQIGVLFFAEQDLQTATSKAARLIMTGQAQTQGMSSNQFIQQVCNFDALFTCAAFP